MRTVTQQVTPKPIFVIGLLCVASSLYGLFRSHDIISQIASVLALLLGIGLIMRKEIARKTVIIVALTSVVLIISTAIYYATVTNSIHKQGVRTQQTLDKIALEQPVRQAQINRAKGVLNKKENELHQTSRILYGIFLLQIVMGASLTFYLTRPHVRQAFK